MRKMSDLFIREQEKVVIVGYHVCSLFCYHTINLLFSTLLTAYRSFLSLMKDSINNMSECISIQDEIGQVRINH